MVTMARVNRTRFAILGMLISGPRSGYDLKKDFEEQISSFWNESLGQIYPALKRLHEESLVTVRVKKNKGRPERKVYRITAKGETLFQQWLKQPAEPMKWRNELLLKVFFGPAMKPDDVLEHIERFQRSELEKQQLYQYFAGEIETREATPERRLYWRLCLSSGQRINRARLDWCREAIEEIKSFVAQSRQQNRSRRRGTSG